MVVVLAMKGHPGCGKSTLARRVGMALRWPVLDKDDLRDCTLALQLQAACPAALLNDFSYQALWRVLETQLQLGLSAIVDCPLARPSLFLSLASIALRHSARLLIIECIASDAATWRCRLEARAARDDVGRYALSSGDNVKDAVGHVNLHYDGHNSIVLGNSKNDYGGGCCIHGGVPEVSNCDHREECQQDAQYRRLNAIDGGYDTPNRESKHSYAGNDRNSCADCGNDDAVGGGAGAIYRNGDGHGHGSNDDGDEQKQQRKGEAKNKYLNVGNDGDRCVGWGDDDANHGSDGGAIHRNADGHGSNDSDEQKEQSQKPADHSRWLESHNNFYRTDNSQKMEQVNKGTDGSFPRGWHKPGSWDELQTLIKGYENCWEYDTSSSKKLVIDTTVVANIDIVVLDVLKWITCITDDSAAVSYLP